MNPREFCTLAVKLASMSGAAAIRTAISRAYYAVHHVGVELLEGMKFEIAKTGKAHKQVISLLSISGHPLVEEAGSKLADLYQKRRDADYRLANSDIETPNNARLMVVLAQRIISDLEQSCKGSQRKQIIESIRLSLQGSPYPRQ
jgi:hypothetical protein